MCFFRDSSQLRPTLVCWLKRSTTALFFHLTKTPINESECILIYFVNQYAVNCVRNSTTHLCDPIS